MVKERGGAADRAAQKTSVRLLTKSPASFFTEGETVLTRIFSLETLFQPLRRFTLFPENFFHTRLNHPSNVTHARILVVELGW